ncbi:xanthine dehydrogenase family protein molybdopterin-binding subunit [Salipiger sp. IMCC34102]|uniref:xanthine dehydrogenase family protein molybdopterin-binding subunit n=1 Tax=Salipiger sp. IMCC34102 TaxID=2510647 RepID=UPI00101BF8C6|nr:xanthine dehydrogenase family protein molybdopterin-binding subunit [Salipiger sp. IMCC34102]RYH02620.1 xanthine dehydrogenase family protein molybdopterin-binding subunit [Salipiger sp. IMCC34102]
MSIGNPVHRIDGKLKVTGSANYAADFSVGTPLYAELVTSTVGLGRVTSIDDSAARAVPGVRAVYSHANPLPVDAADFFGAGGRAQQSWRPFESADVRFNGEIVGLVVADTLIGAREAARSMRVQYEEQDPAAVFGASGLEPEDLPDRGLSMGDIEQAMEASSQRVEETYTTYANTHNAMELFSTTAQWAGDELTVYVPSQWVEGFAAGIAEELGIDAARVRVVSPYVGGGFGGKGSLFTWTAMVAAAARDQGRPVKLYVTREQGFTTASYRAETEQDFRLGATADGRFTGFEHQGREISSRADTYVVNGGENTARMYHADAVRTGVTCIHADRQTPGFMRAPPEAPYFFALESGVDELAWKLSMDPVELRRINDIDAEPVNGVPFTSRSLMECYDAAAERFGWSDYEQTVGARTEGDWLVGWGCATATYPTQMGPCAVRIHFDATGQARVWVASHDVGTGAYTVIAQATALALGIPVDSVKVELGDSRLPPGTIAGGSISTASNVSAIEMAVAQIHDRMGTTAETMDPTAAFEAFGQRAIEEYAEWIPPAASRQQAKTLYNGKVAIVGGAEEDYTAFAFGAQFAEVRVHKYTREIRVPRLIGAFAAGRIMNEQTARSQYLGGMIWGIGHALLEKTEVDPRNGKIVNANIAEYLVPTNADVQELEAILVPETDTKVNPAGVKGIGEIGIVGTAAAIANAVYHATGTRVRHTPIHVEDLLPQA